MEEKWPHLSILRRQLIDAMVLELNEYFPEGSLELFEVLNPSLLPNNVAAVGPYSSKIIPLAERFQFNTTSMVLQFSNLLQIMISEWIEHYCSFKRSEPHIFWSHSCTILFETGNPKLKSYL